MPPTHRPRPVTVELRFKGRVKRKRLKLILPPSAKVLEKLNLDEVFEATCSRSHSHVKSVEEHSDALVVFDYRGRRYALIIEDVAGAVKPRDMERLKRTERELRAMGRIPQNAIVVRILHHEGLGRGRSPLTKLARHYRVTLIECGETIDIARVKHLKQLLGINKT